LPRQLAAASPVTQKYEYAKQCRFLLPSPQKGLKEGNAGNLNLRLFQNRLFWNRLIELTRKKGGFFRTFNGIPEKAARFMAIEEARTG
jgi:hypothetical protein